MSRIAPLDPQTASGPARALLDGVKANLGVVPNLFRVLGQAPGALQGYLDFSAALAGGSFSAQVREQIALVVAETNQCSYCLSAHSYVGQKVGLAARDIANARGAQAVETRTDALLKLARAVVVSRGEISEEEFRQARAAGLTDGDVVETIANVALNILTNYVNHVAKTVIDFPEVTPGTGSPTTAATTCDCH